MLMSPGDQSKVWFNVNTHTKTKHITKIQGHLTIGSYIWQWSCHSALKTSLTYFVFICLFSKTIQLGTVSIVYKDKVLGRHD